MLVSTEMSGRSVQKAEYTPSPKLMQNDKSNENKSTPRKRKRVLDKLKSDLSPKYIGADILRTNVDEKVRALRRKRAQHEPTLTPEKLTTVEHVFTPYGISVRRISGGSITSTKEVGRNKEFVSPIEKLLLSNGSKALLEVEKIMTADLSWFTEETKNANANEELVIECKEETKPAVSTNLLHSPSTLSFDSGKGSSEIGLLRPAFVSGDIYWGQIYNFCYWPCIVFPDPEGKTITTVVSRKSKQNIVVHVRFFADHGRRNWVKRENLIPYEGLDSFKIYTQQMCSQFGVKSNQYKFCIPTRSKEQYWLQAIEEADRVAAKLLNERLETFENIQKESSEKLKIKRRERSLSMKMDNYSESGSSEEDRLNMKRARSSSPTSPIFSPIKQPISKRHKANNDNIAANLSYETNNVTLPAFLNAEDKSNFKNFYKVMRNYIFEEHTNLHREKSFLNMMRTIWSMKHMNHNEHQQTLLHSLDEPQQFGSSIVATNESLNEEKGLRRLSNRLKYINLSRTLSTPTTLELTANTTPEKPYEVHVEKKQFVKIKKRPIEEVVDDILRLDAKYLFKGMSRDSVCKYCLKTDNNLLACQGYCLSYMHVKCSMSAQKIESETENMQICEECKQNEAPFCFVCRKIEDSAGEKPIRCNMSQCARYLHESCCKYWPQAKFVKSKNIIESCRCPAHVCHTCVSDDPKGKFQHLTQSKLTRCIKCLATYHTDSACIPAGSKILSASCIICPRHAVAKTDQQINVNWCFICVGGGSVICCETCPIAVHDACLKLPLKADEGYICEECESGRLPLYGELVWAKFNSFRWWPALILPPTEIPTNVQRLAHNEHDIALRFFGTHDHAWISRRRVYLFVDGDHSEPQRLKQGTSRDKNYMIGVKEAVRIHELINQRKLDLRLNNGSGGVGGVDKSKLQPQPYVKIKCNRAIPPVKFRALDLEEVGKCDCDPNVENPCDVDMNCLNRMLFQECNPKTCNAGTRCRNQLFESRVSPALDVVYMKHRGFGLVCRQAISAGTFIIEYVGEVISDAEFAQRLRQKEQDRDENFYFLSLEKDRVIDAGPKGNLARFMNHSCDPNCETQKWMVNCNNRVGIFAIKDIPENTELTFNYLWDDLLSKEKKHCFCGASNCKGLIGGKLKEDKLKNNAVQQQSKSTVVSVKRRKMKKLKVLIRKEGKKNKGKLNRLTPTFNKIAEPAIGETNIPTDDISVQIN